jgi:hypothetical protein
MSEKFTVVYGWVPESPPGSTADVEIAGMLEQTRLPRIGQIITWVLPQPDTVGQDPPLVIAKGTVTEVAQAESGSHIVYLRREHTVGMSYQDLCMCIHAEVVGFHPDLGCVEGRLIGLFPKCELAGIADPQMADLVQQDDEPPVIWVDWATVWTVQGLEAMARRGRA